MAPQKTPKTLLIAKIESILTCLSYSMAREARLSDDGVWVVKCSCQSKHICEVILQVVLKEVS